ncbi:GPI transamidase subunit PIG-U family protein [Pelomyxa schiedti]|nr:GPI transamidase subunit PIG-U family protein [Pelomyxa schiedti]
MKVTRGAMWGLALVAGCCMRWVVINQWDVSRRPEIATPVTAYHRMMEGLFLMQRGESPYFGWAFHQAPLLLPVFDLLNKCDAFWTKAIFSILDLLITVMLYKVATWSQKHILTDKSSGGFETREDFPDIVALIYFCSPLSVLASGGLSLGVFSNFFVISSIFMATLGPFPLIAVASLAVSSYLSLYPVILLPAVLLLLRPGLVKTCLLVIWYFLFTGALFGLSLMYTGSWEFLSEVYGFIFWAEDLTPNLGLFWYFFTEMFVHFRVFFTFVFQANVVIYVAPMTIRLRRWPLLLLWALLSVITIFKSYPSVADDALLFALFPLIWTYVRYTRYLVGAGIASICLAVLLPILWSMWIYEGTGNANFYYGACLGHAIATVIFVTDCLSVALKTQFLQTLAENKTKKA